MDYRTVGKRIKKQRVSLDLTQAEAAERAGISEKYYANLERGVNRGRLEIYYKIAIALNLSLDSLVAENSENDSMVYMNYIISQIGHFNKSQKEMLHSVIEVIDTYQIEKRQK